MNRIFRNRAVLFPVALLLLASSNVAGRAFDAAQVVGKWEKEFSVQKDVRNHDPRWELVLFFVKDGTFRYSSKSTTEVWLSNGTARPAVEEIIVEGKWSIDGNGKLIIRFDRGLKDREVQGLRAHLNYDPKINRAVVKCDFDGGLMRLSGLAREEQLFFKKVQGS